jgi:hypothetical protein
MGHGKTWSDEENEALARSWPFASENPINSTDQTGTAVWDTVHERFVELVPSTERTAKALSVRWTTVQREVGKFTGVYVTPCVIVQPNSAWLC